MLRAVCIGNVGMDAQRKVTADGRELATFSVGVYKGKDKTTWVNICAYDRNVDIALKYIKKGIKVYVEGSPRANAYIKEANAVANLTIDAQYIELLGGIKSEPENNGKEDSHLKSDEVPF